MDRVGGKGCSCVWPLQLWVRAMGTCAYWCEGGDDTCCGA